MQGIRQMAEAPVHKATNAELTAPILSALLASPDLIPLATAEDAHAIAAAAQVARKPLAAVALALEQLSAKVVAGLERPTRGRAIAFVLAARGPGVARCGPEERAPVRYRRLDVGAPERPEPLALRREGARAVMLAAGAA